MAKTAQKHWLFKSEPDVYGIADLERDRVTTWEGVRNYQARNFMRDEMQVGDPILFYHSSTQPPGVAGLARVAKTAYPDPEQFDPDSHYYDPKSKPEDPTWLMVDVEFVARFPTLVTLEQLKADPALEGMLVTRRGQRLSIQPVTPDHFDHVRRLGG